MSSVLNVISVVSIGNQPQVRLFWRLVIFNHLRLKSMVKIIAVAIGLLFVLSDVTANSPDIRLQSVERESVSLVNAVNDGKFTLVMIWSTDCEACEEQKPMIQSFFNDYGNSKATVIGIANDGPKLIKEINQLIKKNKPTYPNYIASPQTFFSDFEMVTGQKFRATPTYLMYNPDGKILGVAVGPISRDKLDAVIAQ